MLVDSQITRYEQWERSFLCQNGNVCMSWGDAWGSPKPGYCWYADHWHHWLPAVLQVSSMCQRGCVHWDCIEASDRGKLCVVLSHLLSAVLEITFNTLKSKHPISITDWHCKEKVDWLGLKCRWQIGHFKPRMMFFRWKRNDTREKLVTLGMKVEKWKW